MRTGPGWVLSAALAAAGCGDVVAAGGADGGGDGDGGGEADARPPGEVRITLRGGIFGGQAEPLPDAPTLFLGPDGAVLAETTTDECGEATAADVPSGSTVVVFPPLGGKGTLNGANVETLGISVHGVEPGDDIDLGGESERGISLGSMTVEMPPMLASPGTTLEYWISNGCTEARSPSNFLTLEFHPPCVLDSGDDFTFLARVTNDADGQAVGFAHGTATFDSGGGFGFTSWDDPAGLKVTFTDLPALVDHVGVGLQGITERFPFFERQRFFLPIDPVAGAESLVPRPAGFGVGTVVETAYASNQAGLGTQGAQHRLALETSTLDVDVRDELLAWYGQPVFDAEARALAVSRTSGELPDLEAVSTFWRESDESFHYWLFVVPPGRDQVAFPPLPEAFAAAVPNDPAQIGFGIFGLESTHWDGYHDARQDGFAGLFENPALHLLDGPGRIRRSQSPGNN